MQIVDPQPHNQLFIDQVTAVIPTAFRAHYPHAWAAMCRSGFAGWRRPTADAGTVPGWVGRISQYNGRAWALVVGTACGATAVYSSRHATADGRPHRQFALTAV